MGHKTDIQRLADEALGFYRRTGPLNERPDIYVHCDDAPQWVKDLTMHAHEGLGFSSGPALPDGTRFEYVVSALDALSENADEDEAREACEQGVDIYNADLLAWLSSHLGRPSYCDVAQDEGLTSNDADMISRITAGQCAERSEVFGLVLESLNERVESLESESAS